MRLPGTAVFMTSRVAGVPPMLVHHFEFNRVLHEQVVLLTVANEPVPRIPASERLEVGELGDGFFRVIVHYGFLQSPNVPVALRTCEPLGLVVDPDEVTYYLGRETLIPTKERPGMTLWREKLFAFMVRNQLRATAFYKIPPERVVEIGIQVEF
jgi:KUP system potassium uptake protein